MKRCSGKGYEGCETCSNREYDPFQCEFCLDESAWEPYDEEDEFEELSIADLITMVNGEYA